MGGHFKDPMTTAAAIDRLVHHSVIVELGQEPNGDTGIGEMASGAGLRPFASSRFTASVDKCRRKIMPAHVVRREK